MAMTLFSSRLLPALLGVALLAVGLTAREAEAAQEPRTETVLDTNWRTAFDAADPEKYAAFTQPAFDDANWRSVNVPHNWDDYYGFRQMKHGDLHGYAWYRRQFTVAPAQRGRRVFLFFEGVGSYATVWVNGRLVGRHAGGLTTFTLDITDAVRFNAPNLLAVRADHPNGIRDLPWVCGGSERAYGFSEGSQPFGIFRPVRLITTAPVRIEPFGVHVWSDRDTTAATTTLHTRTEIKNYDTRPRSISLLTRLIDRDGRVVLEQRREARLAGGETTILPQTLAPVVNPRLWSLADPYLYTLVTELLENSALIDRDKTYYGIRSIRWPEPNGNDGRFYLNGRPVFINGTCEYEHLLGGSHAFTAEQIHARVRQMQAAGFNAFRDAHHPHNLRYQDYWARHGLLWWTQFGAHIWFDNDAFRTNFKALLRDWVKERRNNPALVLWGLQNESMLPAAFAAECTAIIRELDPTATTQRKIVTCNGGEGTDWNVPQNWTGTYGGDPATYADDLRRQILVGEYGAWRSLDFHTEGGFDDKGPYSEDRMTTLMETKVRLAESVRDEVSGHFHWLFTTHSNPGRNIGEQGEQTRDGIRELDQIGPANNKGLLSIWGEPLDAYYMYRSNYAPKDTEPMVYIVSHTWPDRWTGPGKKSGIIVYSNCDEVELFNDHRERSLGVRKRGGKGTHFQWDDVEINYNTLYAEGRVGGKTVAVDYIVLHHLPVAPALARREAAQPSLTAPAPGMNYLYRVNCGGPEYVDEQGQRWLADREFSPSDAWGASSWAAEFPNLPPAYGSQRKIYDPITGARDDALFQTYRYGREKLRYTFAVPDGEYRIELYFTEPWYGTGGGFDYTGWRLFDVAANGATVLRDLDIWKESGGRAHGLKKTVTARASGGRLEISFPRIASYQAVISAIAIASADPHTRTPALPTPLIAALRPAEGAPAIHRTHLDTGDALYNDNDDTITSLPNELREADWIRTANAARQFINREMLRFTLSAESDVHVAHDTRLAAKPAWLADWQPTGQTLASRRARFELYRKRFAAGAEVVLGSNINAPSTSTDAAMFTVIVERTQPPPPAQIIQNFSSANTGWRAVGHLKAGQAPFRDAGATFTAIPPILTDSDWIQTTRATGGNASARFTVNDHVEVYVALDSRIATPPAWLADWIEMPLSLRTSDRDASRFKLYKRRYAAGTRVELGAFARLSNGELTPYSVIVHPVRAATIYEAENAALIGATLSTELPGYTGTGAVVLPQGKKATIEWTIAVGVGDRYGLNFRYATGATAPIPAQLQIIASDGRVLRTDPVEFLPLPKSHTWSVLRTRTGSSINAGTYKLRLTLASPAPLFLDALEVE